MPIAKKVRIVVRRGALRRFDALARKTSELPVDLTWDRRTSSSDRRASAESPTTDRRKVDRRRSTPYTWEVADFVVVDPSPAPATDPKANTAAASRAPSAARKKRQKTG